MRAFFLFKARFIIKSADNLIMNIKEDFRLALRELVYPVCVVSAYNDKTNENHAITVSSVTSLSFDPPSILVCINRSSSIHASLKKDSHFNISFLSSLQSEISNICGIDEFSDKRFDNDFWDFKNNVGFIKDSQSVISCITEEIISYGSHSVFIGNVIEVIKNSNTRPLLYGKGKYLEI